MVRKSAPLFIGEQNHVQPYIRNSTISDFSVRACGLAKIKNGITCPGHFGGRHIRANDNARAIPRLRARVAAFDQPGKSAAHLLPSAEPFGQLGRAFITLDGQLVMTLTRILQYQGARLAPEYLPRHRRVMRGRSSRCPHRAQSATMMAHGN